MERIDPPLIVRGIRIWDSLKEDQLRSRGDQVKEARAAKEGEEEGVESILETIPTIPTT
jgi:hypothetical protein